MSGDGFAMCRGCRASDIEVQMEAEVRGDCPHCGTPTWQEPRMCCIPDCGHLIPDNGSLPVCRDCGIKIALAHLHDAAMHDVVMAEERRLGEAHRNAIRNGKTGTSVVYYVRLDESRIKIGFTSRLDSRLNAMRIARDGLLACEPGGRELEKQRHHQFRGDRIDKRREDFRASERLLAWIEQVRDQHPLPVGPPDTKTVTVRKAS